jgi:hypothetical protein
MTRIYDNSKAECSRNVPDSKPNCRSAIQVVPPKPYGYLKYSKSTPMVATRIQTDPLEPITDSFLTIQYFNAFVNKLRKVITGLVIIVHCPSVCPHIRARLYAWKHFVRNSSSILCVLRTLLIAPYITPIIFGEYVSCPS